MIFLIFWKVKQMTSLEEQVSQLNREKKRMETKMKEMREKQLSFIEAKVFGRFWMIEN